MTFGNRKVYDSSGLKIYFRNSYGKGKVYFGTFADYFHEDWAILSARHVMDIMGRESRTYCNNPSVAFTERKMDDGRTIIDVINMNCAVDNGVESFKLEIKGKVIVGTVKEGDISTFVI